MRTKPYAGEKIIYGPHKASWYREEGVGLTAVYFHYGLFYVTNKRIIFEGDEISKECIIYLEETEAFRFVRESFLHWANSLYVTKENSPEHFMIKGAESDITKELYSARKAAIHTKAISYEEHLDYARAISLWENIGKPQEATRIRKLVAEEREKHLDYENAIKIYEEINMPKEAARVRKLKADLAAPKTEVHGDYVDDRDTTYIDDRDTIVKDSVISRSNIGAGGDDKFTKLKELTEMKEKGFIDDDEFKQMKKEILGK